MTWARRARVRSKRPFPGVVRHEPQRVLHAGAHPSPASSQHARYPSLRAVHHSGHDRPRTSSPSASACMDVRLASWCSSDGLADTCCRDAAHALRSATQLRAFFSLLEPVLSRSLPLLSRMFSLYTLALPLLSGMFSHLTLPILSPPAFDQFSPFLSSL